MTHSLARFSQKDQLQPLNALDQNNRDYLFSESQLIPLAVRTLVTVERDYLTYLLEGEVSMLSGGFVTEQFNHLQERALLPLFNQSLEQDSAILTRPGSILQVNRKLYKALYTQAYSAFSSSPGSAAESKPLITLDNQLLQRLQEAFNQHRLQLPVLPEAVLRLRQAYTNPDVGSAQIIQIVQTDPVLSARLIRVANSALYAGWREIKTVRDAVRRLGLEAIKNISLSLSVKRLYNAKTTLIKNHLNTLYQQSTAVAAIAHVIALNRTPELDAEQALLSGLVQNLGQIPILKYLDEHPSMLQSADQLARSIVKLELPLSRLIFEQWGFDPAFIEVVENRENWSRDTEKAADYCDVVIAARLLYRYARGEANIDELKNLPVISKLRLMEYDADGQFFMDKAEQQVAEMSKLLDTV